MMTVLVLAACSRRGCACLAGYAPTIGVSDLDPLSFEVYAPDPPNLGRVEFPLGKPAKDAMCPRLPDATTVTLNGIAGTMRSFGGATGTKLADTLCKRADAYWREAPAAAEATSTIVIDDGTSKLTCTLDVGLPLRLVTSSVERTADRVTLVVEVAAEGATFGAHDIQVAAEGELAQMPLLEADMRAEGRRLAALVPVSLLKRAGAHRLIVNTAIETKARCAPPRTTETPSRVHVTARLPFDVR